MSDITIDRTAAKYGEELGHKRDALKAFFDSHKSDDGLKMTADEVAEANKRNDEITELAVKYEKATELEQMAQANESGSKALKRPQPTIAAGKDEVGETQTTATKSLGELFVESDAYKSRPRTAGAVGAEFVIDLEQHYGKAAASGGVKTVFDTAASWAIQNVRLPQPVTPAEQRLTVADLLPQGRTSGSAVAYMEETTTTNAAAETAESGSKPEAAIAFTEKTSAVRKIAVQLPVTDEALDDVPFIESYLSTRLQTFVQQREDQQLLTGNGTAPNLRGILNTAGILTQAKGTDPTPDAVYKAMQLIRAQGFLEPTGAVFHPLDWQDIRLLRTADGLYIWGNPSEAGPDRIWGLSVVQTTAITQNTGLVGAFRDAAEIFRRTDLSLQVGWINDQFIKNQRTILVEERLALVVFRPKGFATVTGI